MSEEMIFPNVTHYSKVDVHVEAGGMNIQHVEHLHQADVLKALGIELEVKRRPRGDGESAHELPECFRTNRARAQLDILAGEGLLDEFWQPTDGVPLWKLGGIADCLGNYFEIKDKWKFFGLLWGKDKNTLRSKWYDAKGANREREFSKKILGRIR